MTIIPLTLFVIWLWMLWLDDDFASHPSWPAA